MFDAVRKYQKVMLGLILLGILPAFVFFGVSGYDQMIGGGGDEVAVVGGQKISRPAFEQAHRQQIERLQQMVGNQVDVKMFDTPAARAQTLEGLITQQALLLEARDKHISVHPSEIQKSILSIEGLTGEDGKFDFERYQMLLAQQNLSPAMFEAQIRQDLTLQQLANSVQQSAIVPKAVVDRLFVLQESRRTVRARLIDAKSFEAGIEPTDEQLAKYYEDNAAAFQVPESVDVEYVVLDRAGLAAAASPSDEELKAFYQQNKAQFTEPEQRRASHILVAVPADADAAAKAAASEKAARLLAQLKAAPDTFADVAKANSDDTGSAEQGGDLGFFSRDMMVKPFSDAAFSMKEGEISELVSSEYGFHIIKVTGSKGSGEKPFDEVKSEIEALYRQQQGAKRYTELAESFTNTVYEQSDSLQPAVEKFSLKLQTAQKVTRNPGPAIAADSPLRDQRLLGLIFGDEALNNKRNTEAIEVSSGVMVSARVTAHRPAARQPFEEVKDRVKGQVVAAEAARLAKAQGEKLLAALKGDGKAADDAQSGSKPADGFSAPTTITRAAAGELAPEAVAAAFKLAAQPLPAYAGVDLGSRGYQLVILEKVEGPDAAAESRRQTYHDQIQRTLAQAAVSAYVDEVKSRTSIERNLRD
jgi:peptidyl-prolyl cis-trans isomerase D